MIAFVEERPSGRWLVVLNERGDLLYTRRVEGQRRAQGTVAPLVSKEQYDADRRSALLSSVAGADLSTNVVPLGRRPGSALPAASRYRLKLNDNERAKKA